jgi:hypothetical protein
MTMITTRKAILAAAALLALGTTALSSTEASAYGFRRGGFHHNHHRHLGHHHFGHRNLWVDRLRYKYGWHHRHHHHHYRHIYWRGPRYVAPVVPLAAGPAVALAPARPPCLAKQYTPEGAVMFIDRCTNESAVSPPAGANGQPEAPPSQQK